MTNGNESWTLGLRFLKDKKYKLAIEKFQDGLKFFEDENNELGISSCILGLALVNIAINDDSNALLLLDKGLFIVKKINYIPGIGSYLMNRGFLYQKIGKYDNALDDYYNSLEYFKKLNDIKSIKNIKSLIDSCKKRKSLNNNVNNKLRKS
ncbi:MAG: hypothetical protein ACTSPY_01475 [Candidatus Helarchaeota archaeon]